MYEGLVDKSMSFAYRFINTEEIHTERIDASKVGLTKGALFLDWINRWMVSAFYTDKHPRYTQARELLQKAKLWTPENNYIIKVGNAESLIN